MLVWSSSSERRVTTFSVGIGADQFCTQMQDLMCEEVAVYSVSCKSQTNINLVLDWLIAHSKK
jgi:hypothetical protein